MEGFYAMVKRWLLLSICSGVLCPPSSAAQDLNRNLAGTGTLVTSCPDIPSPKPAVVYGVPPSVRPLADKKVELIILLRQSIENQATEIDGSKHAPKLDVKLELKIRKIASEIAKGDP